MNERWHRAKDPRLIKDYTGYLSDELVEMAQWLRLSHWWVNNFPAEKVVVDLLPVMMRLGEAWAMLNQSFGVLEAEVQNDDPADELGDPEADPPQAKPEWHRGEVDESERWIYGPYHVGRVRGGSWGIFRGDMILDLVGGLEFAKHLVEKLYDVELEGVMILGEYGTGHCLQVNFHGNPERSADSLDRAIEAAQQVLPKKHRL